MLNQSSQPQQTLNQEQRADPVEILFPEIEDPELSLDLTYPMYDLWAPGMPPPGESFILEAERRSGKEAPKKFNKGKNKPEEETLFTKWLKELYRCVLYKNTIQIPVAVKNQDQRRPVPFMQGHVWSEPAGGPRPARVMIIGKQPGWDDVASKTNFSGPTSQILVEALQELRVPEDEVAAWYITNVVRFPNFDAKNTTVLPATWIKDCASLLHQELRLVLPEFILCLGEDACKALLGRHQNLITTAGQVVEYSFARHESADEEPVMWTSKVMTCMHPARVSRQPDLSPQFKGSLKLFVDLVNGKNIGKEETDLERYELYNQESLEAWVQLVLAEKATCFALDCEWHGSYPREPGAYLRTIQISWGHKKAACVVVRDAKGNAFSGDYVLPLLRILRSTPARPTRIIGHNFRADLPWLVHYGIDVRPEFEAASTPDKTRTEGGFDTLLAVHSWQETHPLGLEACSSQLLGVPRYDLILEKWKTDYCNSKGIRKSDLPGYGECPDEILHPYGNYDADVTWRLFELFNKPGGLLDKDRYGNNSRTPFWISMKASPAFLEMEMNGINLDKGRAEELINLYKDAKDLKLQELRDELKWPAFNPASSRHRTELLFGEKYHTKKGLRIRPPEAKSLYLTPIKSTGRRSKMWKDIIAQKQRYSIKGVNDRNVDPAEFKPSTDKETLGILAGQEFIPDEVKKLRDISFISHLLRTVLRPPRTNETVVKGRRNRSNDSGDRIRPGALVTGSSEVSNNKELDIRRKDKTLVEPEDLEVTEELELDEAGEKIYDKGLLSDTHIDGKIRTHFFQTKETGRASSARPPLQNLSKRREPDYQRILGDRYRYSLRSIFTASPGCVLVEADYSAAEVAGVAWMSGDKTLIEHARRSALDENDPDYFDIHSNIAVRAFQLTCPPTKKGLKLAGRVALRTAAKAVFFGYLYGQGAESAARKAREEGANVSTKEAQALIDSLTRQYPDLVDFFQDCRSRVHNPGWMSNCFGRYRRFSHSTDRQVIGESERQAMNFPIQSLVADAMSRALDNLYDYRKTHPVDYRLLLQIHDAVILDVPIKHLAEVYDTVIPVCMKDMVEVWPSWLDGKRKAHITEPYHLSAGRDVYLHWGDDIPAWASYVMGIPERFCSKDSKDDLKSVLGWLPQKDFDLYAQRYEELAMNSIKTL